MDWLSLFNARLCNEIERAPMASPRLRDALLYMARSPGKRLRPRFVHESARRFGLPAEAGLTCALSIECIHLFSLVHDDLPELDNDDFRRGLPTLHRRFDGGTALLAGDELLNFAYHQFLRLAEGVPSAAFSTAFTTLIRCVGAEGMIGGQMLEQELLHSGKDPTLEDLLRIQDLKTGSLFLASILVPALLSGETPSSASIALLQDYAGAFGFAFQVADDLEDEHQDRAESKKNILSLMGREAAVSKAISGLKAHALAGEFSATRWLIEQLESKK